MANNAERPKTLNFLAAPLEMGGDKPDVIVGEITNTRDKPISSEEIRFDIAFQLGLAPEEVYIPYCDGASLDAGEALLEGETAKAFAADRWRFPHDPETGPVKPPTLL